MGITGLLKELEGTAIIKRSLKDMAGQTAAIDVSCWIHIGIAYNAMDANQFINRKLANLIRIGIKPLVVFDGAAPDAKRQIMENRQRNKQDVQKLALIAKGAGKDVQAAHLLKKASGRTVEIQDGIKEFCRQQGIAFIQAPHEADAQIAYLMQNKVADFAITEDADLITYNCKKIVFKINKDIGQLFDQDKFADGWGAPFQVECFTAICICRGCDYFPGGIRGFGMTKAKEIYPHLLPEFKFEQLLELLGQYPNLQIPEDFATSFHKAFSTFKHQIVLNTELGTLEPLTPYQDGFSHVDFPWAGMPSGQQVEYWTPPADSQPPLPTRIGSIARQLFYCKSCPAFFELGKELRTHRNTVHPYICPTCSKKFICQAYLTDHMDAHGTEPKHKCDQCDQCNIAIIFWTKWKLGHHKSKQHSGRSYKCPRCNLVLTRSDGLTEHLKICTRPKKAFPCSLCNGSYDTWPLWDAHMRRIHHISRRSQKKSQKD